MYLAEFCNFHNDIIVYDCMNVFIVSSLNIFSNFEMFYLKLILRFPCRLLFIIMPLFYRINFKACLCLVENLLYIYLYVFFFVFLFNVQTLPKNVFSSFFSGKIWNHFLLESCLYFLPQVIWRKKMFKFLEMFFLISSVTFWSGAHFKVNLIFLLFLCWWIDYFWFGSVYYWDWSSCLGRVA